MRKAGDVVYADVDHNGDGVVEFSNRDVRIHTTVIVSFYLPICALP